MDTDLLSRLCPGLRSSAELLVVVAHPDDEVIGAGGQLPQWGDGAFVYVTDGAPANMSDARAAGFNCRADYARARRSESEAALALAGIAARQLRHLGYGDQESTLHLDQIVSDLRQTIEAVKPMAVLTHPYEGGHPDHDSTAFAVHAACQLLRAQELAPTILEFTCYHNRAGIMQTREFLPRAGVPIQTDLLDEAQCILKRRMFDCFESQQHVLQWFPIDVERFRVAPRYDFSQPPHPGKLYYELFDWGMTGERWRELARNATFKLGLDLLSSTRRTAQACAVSS